MKYIAYVKQKDYGCDYTIGCAQTLWRLKAQDLASAMLELRDEVIGKPWADGCGYEDGYWDEYQLSQAILFKVEDEIDVPLSMWYTEAEKQAQERKAAVSDEAERAEFERLKEKFS